VLWWELGHFERAESLLRHSLRILGDEGARDEEAVGRVLLGLLLAERGDDGRSLRLLQAGRSALRREEWPRIAVQARMVLAWEVARAGSPDRARVLLVQGLEAKEQALLEDPRVQWLEGRVWVHLEERDRAERLLETARIQLLQGQEIAHTALCSLDLALFLLEEGRPVEVDGLLEDFAVRFPQESMALESLRGIWRICQELFAENMQEKRLCVPESARSSFERRLRRALRSAGHRVLLPF
jgi:hypothetical protein